MNLTININTKNVLDQLSDVKLRQIPFATSLALNKTAQKVKVKQVKEIDDVFDRATPYIRNSIFVKSSTKQTLTATVGVKDFSFGKGVPAVKPLLAEIGGGERRLKRFEVALRAIGALPSGYVAVPGEGAEIDSYGNMKSSQIRQILSYFKANRDVGYTSNSTAKTRARLKKGSIKKYGVSYFIGSPGDGKSPLGVWKRIHSNFGTAIKPILIFVKSTNYEPIYDFKFVGINTIQKEFDGEFIRAWEQAQRTAR